MDVFGLRWLEQGSTGETEVEGNLGAVNGNLSSFPAKILGNFDMSRLGIMTAEKIMPGR